MAQVLLLLPGATKPRVLLRVPTWAQLRLHVGGDVEMVRVLDTIVSPVHWSYSYMFVNEEGLLLKLPRNELATEVHQRDVRAQYPSAPNPFLAAKLAFMASLPRGSYTPLTPEDVRRAGYDDDPWIAGAAVYFEGYTCEQVSALYD